MWIVGFILVTTVLNMLGIKVAARANFLLMASSCWCLASSSRCPSRISLPRDAGGLPDEPVLQRDHQLAAISAGAAIAAYSFLGFDAVTTLTEETSSRGRPSRGPSCSSP